MRHPKPHPDRIRLHIRDLSITLSGRPATLCAATILLGLTGSPHLIIEFLTRLP